MVIWGISLSGWAIIAGVYAVATAWMFMAMIHAPDAAEDEDV